MLKLLPTSDDVLAMVVSGKISGDDLDTIMDRLDEIMASHDKVHLYTETRGISGLELASLGRYAARALPLLGKLNRFGRIASVSDQAWVRWGTGMESAVLPFIRYRTFPIEEAEAALAWVEGKEEKPAK